MVRKKSGSWFGNVVALPLGGYLCEHGFDGGWSAIFYVFGKYLLNKKIKK